jgi:uncharacterized protein YlxW (UPF0749 family)
VVRKLSDYNADDDPDLMAIVLSLQREVSSISQAVSSVQKELQDFKREVHEFKGAMLGFREGVVQRLKALEVKMNIVSYVAGASLVALLGVIVRLVFGG